MKFHGKQLRGIAIFYCSLIKMNPQFLGHAWISLCKLLNSRPINHTPTTVDTYIFELGDLFFSQYRLQYRNLLNLIKGEYCTFLNTESSKLTSEADVFRLKVDSLMHLAQDQLAKYFHQ